MVVSHRDSVISTNIRAIIEQLNLNPVERRRLIERQDDIDNCNKILETSTKARVSIGVYGLKNKKINQDDKNIIINNNNNNNNERKNHPIRRINPRPRQRVPATGLQVDQVFLF